MEPGQKQKAKTKAPPTSAVRPERRPKAEVEGLPLTAPFDFAAARLRSGRTEARRKHRKPHAAALSPRHSRGAPSPRHDGAVLFPGPLCSGGRAEEKPEGWPAGMPANLASAQDVLSTNSVARTRTLRTGCPQGAEAGWPFSLVTFSLATQRESNSSAVGARKLLLVLDQRASRLKSLLRRARGSRKEPKASRTGCAPTNNTSIGTETAPRKAAAPPTSRLHSRP